MEDDWDKRIDRRFEEIENLLKELAAQRGLSITPRTGPIQSGEGNSGGGPDDRTLLVKIHSMEYRISCEVLELLFSRFGILEDVEILESGSEFHSRIRFRDRDSAIKALEYDGRDIYDGCCRMELVLGDRLNGAEITIGNASQIEESKELDSPQEICQTELDNPSIETKDLDSILVSNQTVGDCFESVNESFMKTNEIEVHPRASFGPSTDEFEKLCVECEDWDREIDKDVENIQFPDASLKVSSIEFLADSGAHNVFEKMPVREFICSDYSDQVSSGQLQLGNWVFDPGARFVDGFSSKDSRVLMQKTNLPKFDPGSTETPNCKHYGHCDRLDEHFECYVDRVDGFNEQTVKQISLKWEEYELKLVTCSQHIASSLMPSCEYNPWILDPKVGVVISIFDPGIISYDWICKLLSEIDPSDGSMLHVHNGSMKTSSTSFFDPGIAYRIEVASNVLVQKFGGRLHDLGESPHHNDDLCVGIILVFDPGGLLDQGRVQLNSSHATVWIHGCWVIDGLILVWDPGGSYMSIFFLSSRQ